MTRKINKVGFKLIKKSEDFRSYYYDDSNMQKLPDDPNLHGIAVGNPTIAYGHNCKARGYAGTKVGMSKAEGKILLVQDLYDVEQCVDREVPDTLTDNQFAALVSYAFNVGNAGFKGSQLLGLVKDGRYGGAYLLFPKSKVTAGGDAIVNGLVNRRMRERDLFIVGIEDEVFKQVEMERELNTMMERVTTINSEMERADWVRLAEYKRELETLRDRMREISRCLGIALPGIGVPWI